MGDVARHPLRAFDDSRRPQVANKPVGSRRIVVLLASSSRHAGVGMDRSAQDPLVLENRHTGERLELRRIAQDGETWLELKGSLPPHRDGPPLHVHHDEDEGGRVLSGTLSAVVDGRKIEVRAGEAASFPRGSAHRWWNDGSETLVLFSIVVLVGSLLGRYQGTEWPGCPTRCAGAPVVSAEDA